MVFLSKCGRASLLPLWGLRVPASRRSLRLLLGFENPETGSIYYDREDFAQLDHQAVTPADWRCAAEQSADIGRHLPQHRWFLAIDSGRCLGSCEIERAG